MISAEALAAAVVRAWTFVYTIGMSAPIREARRDEIASDLWEHVHAGSGSARSRSVAGQILARCLLGIGADLSWRVEMARVGTRQEEVVPMTERIKRDGWLVAPFAIVAFGLVAVAAHITAGGFQSWWADAEPAWDPSPLARAGSVLLVATLFVGLPLAAMALRRSRPGWTLVLLMPAILFTLTPLAWGEATWWLLVTLVGVVALIGAVANLAQHSVRQDLEAETAVGR